MTRPVGLNQVVETAAGKIRGVVTEVISADTITVTVYTGSSWRGLVQQPRAMWTQVPQQAITMSDLRRLWLHYRSAVRRDHRPDGKHSAAQERADISAVFWTVYGHAPVQVRVAYELDLAARRCQSVPAGQPRPALHQHRPRSTR